TLAKLANSIVDTPVLMAVKSHLRNNLPIVIAVSTNDALSGSAKNIGVLQNTRNVYFVPMGQDNYEKKPTSLVAHFEYIENTVANALMGRQIQPILM
ncbi:MAG: dipicolinate synthase subunit B, partial [Oscillospiraceae bacterium]